MAELDQLDTGIEEAGLPTLVTAEGSPEFDYSFCLLEGIDSKQVQVILIAVVDDKYLVAVPTSAWHRVASKRLLRPQTLARASAVEVSTVKPDAREVELAQTMKIWVGFLNPAFDADLELQDPLTVPGADVVFGNSVIPFAGSLFAAANDHFAFISAESGMDGHPVDSDGAGGQGLHERVGRLETTLDSLAKDLKQLLGQTTGAETVARTSALKRSQQQSAGTPRVTFTDLDPSVAAAASSAGVSQETLTAMRTMLGGASPAAMKFMEPKAKTKSKSTPAEVLSESEEEVIADASGSASGSSMPLEAAFGQIAGIMKLLTEDKLKKKKAGKVEAALDAVGGGSTVVEGVSVGSGKRAAAARRALRQALVESPEEISSLIERLMMEDMLSRTIAPGMPMSELCARAWVEHRSRIGAYRVSAHAAWAAAGILDDLIQGSPQAARAKAALLLLQLDQSAIDKGSWTLAGELSLETAPPFASLSQHVGPAISEGESPYSRLLDPRWSEIALAYLRDTEDYLTKRRGLNKKPTPEDDLPSPKRRPQPKSKAKAAAEAPQDA